MTVPLFTPTHAPCGRPATDRLVAATVSRTDPETGRTRRDTRVVGRTVSCAACGVAVSYVVRNGRRIGGDR